MTFQEYLKNKRVVFVGACPNLQGTNYGEYIDSFDVVCKSNGSMFLNSEDYYRDYGKRIDVLYTNHQFFRECKTSLPPKKAQWLRMKSCSFSYLQSFRQKINAEIIKSAMAAVNVHGALMGLYIIQDILSTECAELHLCGVDFFVSKRKEFQHDNYREYLKGYLPDKIRIQGNRLNAGKKEDIHNMKLNTEWIYTKYLTDERLSMPDNVLGILMGIIQGKLEQQND